MLQRTGLTRNSISSLLKSENRTAWKWVHLSLWVRKFYFVLCIMELYFLFNFGTYKKRARFHLFWDRFVNEIRSFFRRWTWFQQLWNNFHITHMTKKKLKIQRQTPITKLITTFFHPKLPKSLHLTQLRADTSTTTIHTFPRTPRAKYRTISTRNIINYLASKKKKKKKTKNNTHLALAGGPRARSPAVDSSSCWLFFFRFPNNEVLRVCTADASTTTRLALTISNILYPTESPGIRRVRTSDDEAHSAVVLLARRARARVESGQLRDGLRIGEGDLVRFSPASECV